jgi:iron(III) transport system substrate-binding protein
VNSLPRVNGTLSRRSVLRGIAALGGASAAGAVLAACGAGPAPGTGGATGEPGSGSWSEVVAKANEEGSVTMYYSFTDQQFGELQKAFEKQYPDITLEGSRQLGSTGAFEKLETERTTGVDGADVFSNGGQAWIRQQIAQDPGRFLSPLVGPNVAKLDRQFVYEDRVIIPLVTTIVFGRNTNVVPDAVTTYEQLLQPQFKGSKIGLPDYAPNTSIAYTYSQIVETFGWEYLEQLAAQKPAFYTGSTVAQALAAGEVVVTNYAYAPTIDPLVKQGAPLKMENPTGRSKALGAAINMEILGWTKRPNAAQVLVDFMATREGQIPVASGNTSPSFPGLPGSVDIDINQVWTFNAQTVPADFEARWRSTFGR